MRRSAASTARHALCTAGSGCCNAGTASSSRNAAQYRSSLEPAPLSAAIARATRSPALSSRAALTRVAHGDVPTMGDPVLMIQAGSVLGGTDSNVQLTSVANNDLLQY